MNSTKIQNYSTMRYFFLLMLITLLSCSPQKKLQRLIKKHPELAQTDTINVIDTVTYETIKKDTVFSKETFYDRLRDTIIINNDRLTIRQFYHSDSIFIEGECKGDTIISVIPIEVEKLNNVISNKIPLYFWLLFGGVVLITILALIKKR